MRAPLRRYFEALLRHYGPQRWWPGETPFEVMVGAVLTQNTSWNNVRKAVQRLKERGLLDPFRLHALPTEALADVIRPAGYYRIKAGRLKNLAAWLVERWDGDLERLRNLPLERLREELLGVKGVGPETADSILLYALGLPSFVVDAYTYRLLTRHAKAPEDISYAQMKALFERELPRDAALYNEFHALIVAVGKDRCRPVPRCTSCPLRRFLPRGGKRTPPGGNAGGGRDVSTLGLLLGDAVSVPAGARADDVNGLEALFVLFDLKLHGLAGGQGPEAFHLDRRVMDEDVLRHPFLLDEPVPLLVVKPLHRSRRHPSNLPYVGPEILCPPARTGPFLFRQRSADRCTSQADNKREILGAPQETVKQEMRWLTAASERSTAHSGPVLRRTVESPPRLSGRSRKARPARRRPPCATPPSPGRRLLRRP